MAKSTSFTGELLHFGAVRFRVNGSGNLQISLNSLDEVVTSDLADIVLSSLTAREPVVLANYISQRGFVKIETTEIDETFVISKMTVFVRPVATGYPQ